MRSLPTGPVLGVFLLTAAAMACGRAEEGPRPDPPDAALRVPEAGPPADAAAAGPEKAAEAAADDGLARHGAPPRSVDLAKGAPVFAFVEVDPGSWDFRFFRLDSACRGTACEAGEGEARIRFPAAFVVPVEKRPVAPGTIVVADSGHGADAAVVESAAAERIEVRWIAPFLLGNPAAAKAPTSSVSADAAMPRPEGVRPLAPVARRTPSGGWVYREVVATFGDHALVFAPLGGPDEIEVVPSASLVSIPARPAVAAGSRVHAVWGPLLLRPAVVKAMAHHDAVFAVDFGSGDTGEVGAGALIASLPQ